MTIGFSNGSFYRIEIDPRDRFTQEYINRLRAKGEANAIELHCINEEAINVLIEDKDTSLSGFEFISLHTPSVAYAKNEKSRKILDKMRVLVGKYKINNLVFHTDTVLDWGVFDEYKDLPISIENMDDRKKSGKSVEDVRAILEKHDFGLTLDLQHCFVNDESLQLALDFQEEFGDRIVEYHISGFNENFLHYSLFKTKKDQIISALLKKDLPIIIESTFDEFGEEIKELEYIKQRL